MIYQLGWRKVGTLGDFRKSQKRPKIIWIDGVRNHINKFGL